MRSGPDRFLGARSCHGLSELRSRQRRSRRPERLLARDGRAWLPISADRPHAAIRPNFAAPVAAKVTP